MSGKSPMAICSSAFCSCLAQNPCPVPFPFTAAESCSFISLSSFLTSCELGAVQKICIFNFELRICAILFPGLNRMGDTESHFEHQPRARIRKQQTIICLFFSSAKRIRENKIDKSQKQYFQWDNVNGSNRSYKMGRNPSYKIRFNLNH